MARSANDAYAEDPILRYRPPFAQSLPVQIFFTGIALALAAVLLLHLIFTAQYHWSLTRTNYVLQLTGVTTLLISVSATIYVVFSATIQQSQHWPYMLSYLAVKIPHHNHTINSTDPTLQYIQPWTAPEKAAWVVLNTTSSVIVQLTHIHFLTLLFPSDLEARLIFGLIGPLAIISAVMQLLPLIRGHSVANIAEDTRNVCNAALSVLFTAFLIIWGFFVNRRQAWRTDGGTAAFGVGAITLALVSTSLNFLYIPRQDQYTWMPKLMWAITLWQSFLSWWWWVGAGMGVREVEELLERENKRQQKRLLRAHRRKQQREKAVTVWKGVTDAFKPRVVEPPASSQDGSTVSAWDQSAWMQPVLMVQRWFERLRHAHLTAAHIQATERAERLQQVYHRDGRRNSGRDSQEVVGWGRGSFRMREAARERQEELEMQTVQAPLGEDDEEEWKDEPAAEDSVSERQLRYRGTAPERASLPAEVSAGASLWWWGPLRQWRLKDSTTYR